MHKFAGWVLGIGICALIAVAGGSAKDTKIEGSWTAVAGSSGEDKIPEDTVTKIMLFGSLKDGKYELVLMGKQIEEGAYTVNATKKPATIDLTIKVGKDKGKKQLGIFQIEADKLTVAYGGADTDRRPKSFQGAAGVDIFLFKRNK